MKAFERAAILPVLLLMSLILSGCPLMMPFMASPMVKDYLKPADARVTAALNGLIEEGINDLVMHRGHFDRVLAGQTRVRGDIFPPAKFRSRLFEKLRTNGKLLVLDQEKQPAASPPLSETAGNSSLPLAVIDAQLYVTGDRLFLTLQLLDSRSNQLFWSGVYSRELDGRKSFANS